MDINTNNQSTPIINDMLYAPAAASSAEPDVPPVTPIYPSAQTSAPQPGRQGLGFWGWLLAGLALIALIAGLVILTNRFATSSQLRSLQAQVEQLEQQAKTGKLTSEDQNTLDNLQASVEELKTKTKDLPSDTKTQLSDLTKRLETVEATTSVAGATGATGATGQNGNNGANGQNGANGSNDCISGICVSRQTTSPGTAETGNINLTGAIIANSITANGAGLTALNASNLATGTVADGRLSSSVTLQGNTFNGISQLVQTTAGGALPALSGLNLTQLNATNIASGTVADARLSAAVSLLGQTISNAELDNASVTVTAGAGLSGGGVVALGGSTTLTNAGVTAVTGTANQVTVSGSTGSVTFSLPQSIATSSSPTFADLTLSGGLSVTGAITAGSYTRSCPTGYVVVPGNPKFGTVDFCVMKYEAKDDGAGNAVSTASGTPWVSISQRTSQDESSQAGGHLISEAEWMTIAENALWQSANWCNLDGSSCGNAPGTAGKYLASGHNDNAPAAALVASSTDSEACFGTVTAGVNTTCGSAGTQKRTLTLSNGSVIWDIPGDVWEWTDGWIIGNEQPNDAVDGFGWHEFTAITKWKDLNYANPTNRDWNSGQRLGQIYTDGTSTNNTSYGFLRGGHWGDTSYAGAFTLSLNATPTIPFPILAFVSPGRSFYNLIS